MGSDNGVPLPDTPAWSWRRVTAVLALFLVGLAMVAGCYLPEVPAGRIPQLLDRGAGLMELAVMIFCGGASLERAAAWLGARRAGGS